ncbi:FecR family protein [Microbulbifer halophilus]|uniref:FecR family protein n=1 Tax=Microbulbifer halophilus TaxID=453963 RepID=A0ABW5EE18_9GAMM|nr:FecR domain-containing protein [Microbulbifer halophilus]MCW8126956.1 FecR domain-containing protein [Microbulbifer halophilus]
MKRVERVTDESIERAAADWLAREEGGALGPAERRRLDHWLRRDERHRLAYANCRQLCLMTDFLAGDEELQAEIAGARRPARQRAFGWKTLLQLAAVMLLALGAVWLQQYFAVDYYQTQIGEQRVVHLRDGSTLMLNTDSRVGVRYTRGQRSLFLERGEAFFMVAGNPQRPFVVDVQGSEVRALGTAFNVALRAGDARVAVTQGVVEVRAAGAGQRRLARMLPGEGFHYSPEQPRQNSGVGKVNLEKVTAWQTDRIYFDNDRLEDAVAEYNRYTTRKMVLVGDQLAGKRISGVFNIGDADALAFALKESFGARINKSDQRILVLPGRD